jgi:hypothetical protein
MTPSADVPAGLAGFLLQAFSPAAAMTFVAGGMGLTAVAATALTPIRNAGREPPGGARWPEATRPAG